MTTELQIPHEENIKQGKKEKKLGRKKDKRTRCTKRNETRKIESKGVKYTQKGRSKKLKGFVRSRH
jgi:hypothetical protein